jgi:hypothetical protein
MRRPTSHVLLALGFLAGCAGERPPIARVGDIALLTAYAHPNAGDAGAAYFRFANSGTTADTLLAVQGPDSSIAMLMTTAGGHMQGMESIALAPGQTVEMIPGGMHVMLSGLTRDYSIGDTLRVTLQFAHAGALAVAAPVVPFGEMPK